MAGRYSASSACLCLSEALLCVVASGILSPLTVQAGQTAGAQVMQVCAGSGVGIPSTVLHLAVILWLEDRC